jgi:hypothetical protein
MECIFFPPTQFFQHKRAREKAAIKIQQAYHHTHNSRKEQPFYALKTTFKTAKKTCHKFGTKVNKIFKDDHGVHRPFAGIVENYNETRELYMIVYEDGDSEEMTHKEVLLFLTMNTSIQPAPNPTALSTSLPATFTIGSRVTIIPLHNAHGGQDDVVTRHTAKFVVVVLNGNETRILPKSILAQPPNPPPANRNPTNPSPLLMPSLTQVPDDDDPTPDETESEGSTYDKLDETQNVQVADGFVSFTQTFRYLGSLIS